MLQLTRSTACSGKKLVGLRVAIGVDQVTLSFDKSHVASCSERCPNIDSGGSDAAKGLLDNEVEVRAGPDVCGPGLRCYVAQLAHKDRIGSPVPGADRCAILSTRTSEYRL